MPTTFTIANVFTAGDVILAEDQNENWEDAKDYFDALSSGNNFIPGAILTVTLGDASVTTAKIVNDNVTTAKIADGAVTAVKLATDAVTTIKIQDGQVTAAKLATDAVTTIKILDANVTSAKLASSLTLTTPNIGAATGTSLNTTGNVISHIGTNEENASYTLLLADDGKIVEMNVASGNTLTVAPDSTTNFTIGTQILILQTGAGQTTLTQGAGVTINATPGLKLREQWSSATLIKRDANLWVALGDLSA